MFFIDYFSLLPVRAKLEGVVMPPPPQQVSKIMSPYSLKGQSQPSISLELR